MPSYKLKRLAAQPRDLDPLISGTFVFWLLEGWRFHLSRKKTQERDVVWDKTSSLWDVLVLRYFRRVKCSDMEKGA